VRRRTLCQGRVGVAELMRENNGFAPRPLPQAAADFRANPRRFCAFSRDFA
jgi:hypothetical protein